MKKQMMIWILMFSVLLAAASAYQMCGDTKEINQNCTMITNVVSGCAEYNYTIYNITDWSVAQTGGLTLGADEIYVFNITIGSGDYLLKLCTGFTRELKVKSQEDSSMIAVTIIMIALIVFLIYIYKAINFESPNETITEIINKAKLLFIGLAIVIIPGVLGFGIMILKQIGATQAMIDIYSRFYYVASIASYLLFAGSIIYIIISIFWVFVKKQKDESVKRFGR